MSEENKALARRWFEEVFDAQNFDVADEITAQDSVNHDPTLTDLPSGSEGDRHVVNLYHGAFPDAQITVEDQIAEGDKGGHSVDRTRHPLRGVHGRSSKREPYRDNGDNSKPLLWRQDSGDVH
jgi:hypothetical protein